MHSGDAIRLHSFWRLQAMGWGCFCFLSVLFVLPYIHQPRELGYPNLRYLFADQGLICVSAFAASLLLRPVCRSLLQGSFSWISTQVRAVGWSLLIGTFLVLAISRLTLVKPDPMELVEACAKMSVTLVLWCNLYFGFKQWEGDFDRRKDRPSSEVLSPQGTECISRFTVRTGRRIQIVSAADVAWISAARDYVELHTQSSTHLLRDTMNSLEQKLEPTMFARIHRSKIINLARIVEVQSIENSEYVVRLCDGSEHRSSRTYAHHITSWLLSGGSKG